MTRVLVFTEEDEFIECLDGDYIAINEYNKGYEIEVFKNDVIIRKVFNHKTIFRIFKLDNFKGEIDI